MKLRLSRRARVHLICRQLGDGGARVLHGRAVDRACPTPSLAQKPAPRLDQRLKSRGNLIKSSNIF